MCFYSFVTPIPLSMAATGASNALIGIVIAASALLQVPFAVVTGVMIARWGPVRALLLGGLVYTTAGAMLTIPTPHSSFMVLASARSLVGIGIVIVLASAYSIVPELVPAVRIGLGLGVIEVANNIAFAIAPWASTSVYEIWGLPGVGLTATSAAITGCLLVLLLLTRTRRVPRTIGAGLSGFISSIQPSWVPLLAIGLLTSIYFGTALAFLSPRAEFAGLNAGLFFSANGVTILLLKLPAGFLADTRSIRALTVFGIGLTGIAVAILIAPPTAATMLLAGFSSGMGAAFTSSALLTALARRSGPESRGAAYSASGLAQSLAIASGGLLGAALVSVGGFELAMVAALAALGLAYGVVLRDRWGPARG